MTNIWREIADPIKHRDFMSTRVEGGVAVEKSRDGLIEKWVYFARVDGFTFQFVGLDQVRECKTYFEQKIHPSTKDKGHIPHEHYWQAWHDKLPKGVTSEKNRRAVMKALDKVLTQWA